MMKSMEAIPCVYVLLLLLITPSRISAQLTSSRTVAVLPIVASSSDSALSAHLYESLVTTMQPFVLRRGVQLTLTGQGMTRRELISSCSRPIEMDAYAQKVGAAFLVGGGVSQRPSGEYLVSLILYGVDDRTIIAAESHSFSNAYEVREGIVNMARAISRPRILTPSDTPIMYSMFIPGTGQLMMGKPLHAIVFAGLCVRAITREPDIPRPEHDLFLPRWRKEMKRRQVMNVVAAWLVNVADTMMLCRAKQAQVDPSIFFSIIETHARNGESKTIPMAGIRIRFMPR